MSAPAAPLPRLTMLGRGYCHLCDDMAADLAPLVERAGTSLAVVDIDDHPALEARYGERVPVLFAGDIEGGRELCSGRLDRAFVEHELMRG